MISILADYELQQQFPEKNFSIVAWFKFAERVSIEYLVEGVTEGCSAYSESTEDITEERCVEVARLLRLRSATQCRSIRAVFRRQRSG